MKKIMENDLDQAFHGVFCSSKEIIKNNQRHLYVNMLDLLGRTCRTTGLAENLIGIDNLVEFWIGDLLPLIFDRDPSIQTCAVSTMEQGLALLEPSKIHQSKHWPQLRQMIITEYPDKIHKLREAKNVHWHEIWRIAIEILDREILKGATVINSFLSVVELGFRSADSNVRADAFFCWRLLIKIFATYDELLTPKRLKLICIPLKSSQSKSSHSANVKIRVWWYFITCIGRKLGDHFESAVEPFLTFIFGTFTRDSGAIYQYNSIQPIALLCLAQLLMEDRDEVVERSVSDHNLEHLELPSPLLSVDVLTKQWQPIINAMLAAVRLLCTNNSYDANNYELNQHVLNMLLSRMMNIMISLNLAICSKSVSDGLLQMLPTETLPLRTALSYVASNGFFLESPIVDIDNYSASFESYLALLIAGKPFVPPAILQRCIEQLNKTQLQNFQGEQNQWKALCAIIKVICCSTDKDDFAAFETRLNCWRILSQAILGYLRDNNLSYRRKDFAEVVNGFILWPLRHFSTFAGRCQTPCFDDDFCASWRQLLLSGQNAPDREQFLNEIKNVLREFIVTYRKELPLAELIDAYAAAMLKLNTGKDNAHIKDICSILQEVISLPQTAGTKSFEQYLNTFRNMLLHLKNQELASLIDLIKTIIAQVVSVTMKEKPTGTKFFDDWKQGILERFRSHPQKNLLTQIREVFKKSDVFVIIPSVWMLNPDKLTERQKERFAERSDIPALYNDMSQSQDSSIKPWTPKKIVIAKQNETEIVIGTNEADDQENVNNKKGIDDVSEIDRRNLRSAKSKASESLEDSKHLSSSKLSPLASTNKEDKEEPKPGAIIETPLRTRKSLRSQKLDEIEQKQEQMLSTSIVTKSTGKSKQSSKETGTKIDAKSSQCQEATESHSPKTEKTESPASSKQTCNQETQLNTEFQSSALIPTDSPTEEIILETQSGSVAEASEIIIIESESEKQTESETENNLNLTTIETLPVLREGSPKKTPLRIASLSSPPDRRSTNNTCSPSLRPKPTPHLTGRGAQLIQMIRSKMKIDSPAGSSSPLGASRSSIILARAEKRESTPVPENMFEPAANEHTSTPVQSELLTFTKRLPSPSASPSASILKRKLRRESLDDTPIESPASKRKKVSFHDPPVSVTKEYLKDVDENNIKPKRCLALDKIGVGKTFEIKHALKRRSKLDSMVEIESFGNEHSNKDELTEASQVPSTRSATPSVPIGEACADQRSIALPMDTDQKQTDSMPSTETALEVVVQMCPLETVLDRYFSTDHPNSSKVADTLAKFMSKCMASNSKIKSNVLEVLSENHSKDFLDHAVQENLSSVVCDRLNLNSVIEYICAKSKLNTSCLRSLLAEIPEVLKHCKTDGEPINFIKNLIEVLNPNDGTILDLITMLMRIRNERQSSSQSSPELESTDVSSSNL